MTTADTDKQTRAAVHLALGVSRDKALFDAPTDEELAALIEDRLDATRKAQILNVIAYDPEAFNRWMAVVEMADTLNEGVFSTAGSEAAIESRPSLLERLKSWLRAPVALGGGLATAALVVFVVMRPTGYQAQIDGIYRDYGSDWREYPAESGRVRGTEGSGAILSAQDRALKQGVLEGLDALGDPFDLPSISAMAAGSDVSALPAAQFDALRAHGNVAALSVFKCNLGADSVYFERVLPLLESLNAELTGYSDETSRSLASSLERRGSDEARVCRLSRLVISRVDDL